MPRKAADHGTYRAYLRCKERPEGACASCLNAKRDRSARVSKSAASRLAKSADSSAVEPPIVVPPAAQTTEGHVSRVEVLQELLQESRELVKVLRRSDPARVYLQMRVQMEILRELAELQGNGQAKGVTLADQLAEARARRKADAAAAAPA